MSDEMDNWLKKEQAENDRLEALLQESRQSRSCYCQSCAKLQAQLEAAEGNLKLAVEALEPFGKLAERSATWKDLAREIKKVDITKWDSWASHASQVLAAIRGGE